MTWSVLIFIQSGVCTGCWLPDSAACCGTQISHAQLVPLCAGADSDRLWFVTQYLLLADREWWQVNKGGCFLVILLTRGTASPLLSPTGVIYIQSKGSESQWWHMYVGFPGVKFVVGLELAIYTFHFSTIPGLSYCTSIFIPGVPKFFPVQGQNFVTVACSRRSE